MPPSSDQLGVLIVDDDDALSRTTGDILRLRGFEPHVARTGRGAIELAGQTRVAVALVDLGLPDMDGLDLLAKLREAPSAMEVIVLTGNASLTSAVRAIREQIFDYLLKPIAPDHLVSTLERAGERWRRRRAEAALVETEEALRGNLELLRSVIEGTSDIVFAKDLEGRYVLANSAAAAIAGKRPHEMIGRTDLELFPPTVAAEIMGRDRVARESAESATFESMITPTTGKPTIFLTTKGVFRDRDGEIAGIFGIGRDVTLHRQLEIELRQAQKMEAVGRLAGGIAHDFNNLLSVIMSSAGMLAADQDEQAPGKPDVDAIVMAADRAAGLTRQLLAFSRQQVLELTILDLNELVLSVERILRRVIGEDIELQTRLAPTLAPVKADKGQLEQVLMNLAVNARDAMPKGGTLCLVTSEADLGPDQCVAFGVAIPGRYTILEVSDTGVGMDQTAQARAFEPFFTTKEKGKGTGLGLATVYGIVRQSEGFISLHSTLDRGTTFTVFLPSVSPAGPAAAPPSPADSPTTGHETILLIEDEAALRRVARQVLERQGYHLLVASGGDEAVALCEARRERIDLILTDVVMPGLNGREIVQRLAVIHPEAKVLYMSGYTDDTVLRYGVTQAGTAFLQKPFSAVVLARKVREVLSGELAADTASGEIVA